MIRKINVEEVGSEIDISTGKIRVVNFQDNAAVVTVMESQETPQVDEYVMLEGVNYEGRGV